MIRSCQKALRHAFLSGLINEPDFTGPSNIFWRVDVFAADDIPKMQKIGLYLRLAGDAETESLAVSDSDVGGMSGQDMPLKCRRAEEGRIVSVICSPEPAGRFILRRGSKEAR